MLPLCVMLSSLDELAELVSELAFPNSCGVTDTW